MKEIEKLRPFTKFCITIGMLPSSYKTSLTYEEQLLWLCNYLEETVIPAINNNAEALQEVQTLFTQLKNYVDNYFTSLDVQEEINNKLDKMVEDGTFNNIINQDIFQNINNKLDLIESEYTIIIGDSFIAEYPNNNWGIYLRGILNLNSNNCLIIGEGGAGFYQTGNQNTNWKGLLEANISNIPDLTKVKRVIVAGGTNDVNVPDLNTLLTSISSFHTYFKNTFPNAHLYVGEFGYFANYEHTSSRNKINSIVIPAYKRFSRLERASYLNIELCYRDFRLYTEGGVHPTDEGQQTIAGALNQALNGQYKVERRSSTLNFSSTEDIINANLTFYDILIDGLHTVNLNGYLTLNKKYTHTSSLNLDLGILDNPFIRKSNDNLLCFANFPIVVNTSTAQQYVLSNCRMTINNEGHYILTIPANSLQNDIENITSITIQTTFNFSSYNW